jgi:signal transduction histidine kinase
MIFRRLVGQGGYSTLPGMFKGFIFFGTVAVAALFMVYTQFLIKGLQENVKRDVRMWAKLWELAGAEDSSPRVNAVVFEEIIQKAYFPIIVTDRDLKPVLWARIPDVADNDTSRTAYARIVVEKDRMLHDNGETPVKWDEQIIQYILYDYPPLVKQLQVMPVIEIGVVGVFLIVGFVGFRNIQRAEQRNIWVGMAKETAHQLGTPISSLLGWLELMQEEIKAGRLASAVDSPQGIAEVVQRMTNDVRRLDRVANRFGHIGSMPDTSRHDLNPLIEEVASYYVSRLPHGGKGVRITFEPGTDIYAKVNPELFTWVIENLIKNSLQACDSVSGEITLQTVKNKDGRVVVITVTDNGSGIPAGVQKKVFDTGFSTKKRGWGLGLTLARRIVQEYHLGKIELRESVPHLRTTFQIALDYAPEDVGERMT